MSSEDIQFDGFFREILQRGRGIDNLFLRRNSYFFEQPDSGFSFNEKSFKQEKLKNEEKKKKEKEKA